jgi:hypothetical protein
MLLLHDLSRFYNILAEVAPLSHKLLLLKTSASETKVLHTGVVLIFIIIIFI